MNNLHHVRSKLIDSKRVGLWCLRPHSPMFQLYRGWSVLLMEETEVFGENIDLPRVTEVGQWCSPGTVESHESTNVTKDVLVIQSLYSIE